MNKANKILKYILYTLMIISLIFSIKNKVSALTINQQLTASNVQTQNGEVYKSFNSLFKNQGEGQVIYQFLVTGKRNINTLVMCVSGPNNYSSCSPCQFGSTSGYNDSSTQQVFYSLVCNVDTSNNRYVSNLILNGYAWEPTYINWGSNIQFTNFKDNTDYSQVLSNVDTNLNSISSAVWGTNTYVSQIKNNLDTIITNMNTSNTHLITQIQQQQQQQHQDAQNTQQKIDDINNTMKDDTVDNNQANSFFNDFQTADTGSLMDLVGLPLEFLDSLYDTCQPFTITIPFIDNTITIPCMSTIYNDIGNIINVVKILINGFICYYILKRFIEFIQELKDPNNDDIEVMDL